MTNTDQEYAFQQSRLRMLLLALLGVGMVAASVFVIVVGDRVLERLAGWVGVVRFGLLAVLIAWRAFAATGPALVVSPSGVLDVRLAKRPIPWSAIGSVSGLTISGQRMVHIGMARDDFDALQPTRIAKMGWGANASLVGAPGVAITTQGLNVRQNELLNLITEFAKRYGS